MAKRKDEPKKLEEHFQKFYDSFRAKKKSHNYTICYINPIKQIIKFAKHKHMLYPHQVTKELFEEYQLALYKERGFKYETVRLYFYKIREFLNYLHSKNVEIVKEFQILPPPKIKDERLTRYYTFEDLLKRYIAIQRRWISFAYSNGVQKHLNAFFKYLRAQDIKNVYKVSEGIILKYRDYLWNELIEKRESALVVESQIDRLRAINKFLKFLYRERIIEKMPAFNIDWKAYHRKIREEAKKLSKPIRRKDWVPEPLKELIKKFITYETAKGKSESTTLHYRHALRTFFDFLENKGVSSIEQVTKRTMLDYYTYLLTFKGTRGEGIASSTRVWL